jgi:hypothetical protein
MSNEVRIALISALAGIVGVAVGGAVTYLSNDALQNREDARQRRLTAEVARTAAALEHNRLANVSDRLQVIGETKFASRLQPDDRRSKLTTQQLGALLLTLRRGEADSYQAGVTCVGEADGLGLVPGRHIDSHIALSVKALRACVERGATGLERVAFARRAGAG